MDQDELICNDHMMKSPSISIQNGKIISSICKSDIDYGALDVSRYFNTNNWYQVIGGNAQNYDYFHINAQDFSSDIFIGFSTGFNDHNDAKWEIVIGGWGGKQHVIRDRNRGPILASKTNSDR